jgi:hypothetical protein
VLREVRFSGQRDRASPGISQLTGADGRRVMSVKRRVAQLLCLLAMLLQVATGSLPAGEACFGSCTSAPQKEACCRCCEGDDDAGDPACPVTGHEGGRGCDRCVRVLIPGRDVNVSPRVDVGQAGDVLVAMLPLPMAVQHVNVGLRPARRGHPPPTSPPQLAHLRCVRLLV